MVKAEKLKIENKTVGTRITKPMYDRLLQLLAVNAHLSISDYLRDLIRKDLESKEARE